MSFDDLLGLRASLTIARRSLHGLFLTRPGPLGTAAEAPALLLPNREVPASATPGDVLEVFVTLDSEDRPVATLLTPQLELGDVAFLSVTDLAPFGAFVDWGLPKELLVSKREQTRDVARGERHPIGLVIDRSGPRPRLAGTMRIAEMLAPPLRPPRAVVPGEWLEGEAWRRDSEIGTFVILARRMLGLLPISEPHRLERGERARFRVAHVQPDGKLELSLRAAVHEQMQDDGAALLAALSGPHPPRLGDDSPPERIRAELGLSKKAFKRAVGGLLKRGLVRIDEHGIVVRVAGA